MEHQKPYQIVNVAGKLAKTFLLNPLTPILGAILLLLGFLALSTMPREEDPQIAISGGAVIVAMPGATPEEVENIILNPLERKLREVRGIEHVYGMAMNDVGVVNVMYYIGENREDSNLKLYDKVMQNMDDMPKGVMQPLIKPFDIDIDIPIVTVAFYAKEMQKVEDSKLFEMVRKVQQKINAVENVAKTTLKGARKSQYNIQIDIAKLSGYTLSLGQVMKAVQSIAVNVPNVKGRTDDHKMVVFGVKNAIESVEDVGNVIVAQYMDSPIYLRDVATVTKGLDIQNFQTASILTKEKQEGKSEVENAALGEPKSQITLSVAKLAGTNAVNVSQEVISVLKSYAQELDKMGIGYVVTRNYGERANEAVNELMHHLMITIVIIALMLVFALGWRESIIVTFTVPAILAVTLFTAWMTDQTMNRITLFALLLSLGLLVDAAIIVIENIHRHLHSHGSEGKEMKDILVEATDEIGAPTNIATLAIILTMVPMAFVGGMMGSFMKPIPYNVPVALIASLFVAYIFTPYLSLKLLKRDKHSGHGNHHSEEDDA
ncbi:MAG TPA: efflux RND transporter permease subunit [Sulfurovum sp.]|jgi:multidrug efflux pump subunit AcrB|nr:MAG: multidrug transporter AcrB [Sulfurovum sp. 35-42-20]OYY56394.1 MAG: multidrug transporter AcrB [Sulfurovum sp. 28-43-6]OYZ25441.1 MAG: multidrug transporter AcrB [Sulfurovum sp. 16-42-52]OYZ48095.1 MAG: multidrug transporter AcrB [Sulfurovum sp. 24-42-9]OZA45410.1 MAG: multidrug transporter AcrB [Sulfurovum sp. 17-42-90]OZA61425.1 MAG: multidrug transporter AcrB [Sulfurovum sp. 39-42-12]HQR74710.1 efflux RND transporter permease subunit [Sulfurovum sp.]